MDSFQVFKPDKCIFFGGMNEDKNIFGQNTKKSNHKHLFRTEHRPQQQQAASPQTEKQPKRSCKRSQKNRKITAFRPSPSTFTHVNTNKKQIIQQRPAVCLDRFVLRHCLKLEAQVARSSYEENTKVAKGFGKSQNWFYIWRILNFEMGKTWFLDGSPKVFFQRLPFDHL